MIFLTLLQEKMDFDCTIKNLVWNRSLIYWKINRWFHDIPPFRVTETGMKQFPSQPVSFITTQCCTCRDKQPWNSIVFAIYKW